MSRSVERHQAFEATRQGQTWDVVRFLVTGISPDSISEEAFFGQCMLHEAILRRQAATAIAIIACGGDKELADRGDKTAFSHAAQMGQWDACLMLLGAGAKDDPRDIAGYKPEALARDHGHEALGDFIHQISLARYIRAQREARPPAHHFSIPQEQPKITTPLGYAEPGRLSATIARCEEVMSQLDRVLTDIRVKPIVRSILLAGTADLKDYQPGPVGRDDIDLMGCADHNNGGPAINKIRISKKGWAAARPLVESALNALGVAFDSSTSGLNCTLGHYKLERVAIDFTGREYREFDMTHTGRGICKQQFNGTAGFNNTVFSERTFIQRQELVKTDEWPRCAQCRQPIRPEQLRTKAHPIELDMKTQQVFQAMIAGDKDRVLQLAIEGVPLEAMTIGMNSLAHIGSWCGDGTGWCEHAESLATAMACGTDPSQRNAAGETALHVSAYFGRYFPCLMHLAQGVDPWAKDNHDHTAADLARLSGREKLAELIETIGTARDLYERCKNLEDSMPAENSSAKVINLKRKA
jgi:hypothetical protein